MSDSNFNEQMKKELEELFPEEIGDKSPAADEPVEEEEIEEGEVAEEEGEEEEADGDEGGETEEGDEEEEVAEPEEEPGEDYKAQLEALKNQNDLLLEQMNKLSAKAQEEVVEPKDKEAPAEEPELPDFVGELDLDTLAMDKNVLNSVLNGVVATAVNKAVEQMLVNIPGVVSAQVRQQKYLNDAVEDFYNANEDLIPARKVVAMNTNEIVAEHPDWKLDQVLEEAAKKTRSMLGIIKSATKTDTNESGRKPALPKKTSARRKSKKPSMTKLEQEIADLM